jgi:hypothetical protein
MKKLVHSVFLGGALAAFACMSLAQSAQDNTPSTSTSPQAQQPATPPSSQTPDTQSQQPSASPSQTQPGSQMDQQAPPSQAQQPTQPQNQTPPDTTPDSGKTGNAGAAAATGPQSFTGTIVKQGDKYMFQDSASGNRYDIDHQDEVAKYDGKKVNVHGVLDGKTIHLQ